MAYQSPRKIYPGEVDHEIDFPSLYHHPKVQLHADVRNTCDTIFHRYAFNMSGEIVPDKVFCDLDRSVFLEYLIHEQQLVLDGTPGSTANCIEPRILSDSLIGWDTPRYIFFRTSIEAIYFAITDIPRLKRLNCKNRSSVTLPFACRENEPRNFYFGVDFRVLGEAPWSSGIVTAYRKKDIPESNHLSDSNLNAKIQPVLRVRVIPSDWPMLDKVSSIDPTAQMLRQFDSFQGYPWVNDDDIHPGRWKIPLVEALRNYLDCNTLEQIGLAQLSKLIGSTPSRTLRIFRSVVGESPHDYHLRKRIEAAKFLLQSGRLIGDVAIETGFYDQAHFTQHFRLRYGLTPAQYLRTQESPINGR